MIKRIQAVYTYAVCGKKNYDSLLNTKNNIASLFSVRRELGAINARYNHPPPFLSPLPLPFPSPHAKHKGVLKPTRAMGPS